MKFSASSSLAAVLCSLALLVMTVYATPMDPDDAQMENGLVSHQEGADELPGAGQWDAIDTNALRKLLMQIDEERFMRAARSWPPSEGRNWGLRNVDGRIVRQWRADKRQVRFRQCYFNPISCFRK